MKAATPAALPLAPLALAFVCVGAGGLSTIAADTLFVSVFSLGELSRFLGVSAVVRVAAAFVYAAVVERVARDDARRAGALDAVVLGLTAALLAASAVVVPGASPTVIYVVCLAQLLVPPLLPLIAFNALASLLAARQAKRVLPLVAAAATIGSIAVGGLATYVAPVLGVHALFAVGAALCLPAIPILVSMARAAEPAPSLAPPSAVGAAPVGLTRTLLETLQDMRRVPAVRVVVVIGFFGAMAANFVDFAFKAALKEAYGPEAMAAALGGFTVLANTVVLAFQVLLTGRIVARLGVGRALLGGPAALGAVTLASVALPGVLGTGTARLAEFVARYGLGNSIGDVLLVPLARAIRTRAKIIVKGSATPIGGLVSAGVLTAFGADGPSRWVVTALVVGTCAALLFLARDAPRAYATALAAALSRGRVGDEIAPEAASLFRAEVGRLLSECIRGGRFADAQRTLDLMTDRFFSPSDVTPALATTHGETRRAAVLTAARLTGPSDGGDLLALLPPDADPEVETTILRAAREHGALADPARVGRAVEHTPEEPDAPAKADLWAEGLLHDALAGKRGVERREPGAQARLDAALKQLRKGARRDDGPTRTAALRSIGLLGDRRAEREVLIAMAARDPVVFQEAARAAVLLDAAGAVSTLVARLVAGPHAAIAARSLALAGPRAVRELVNALPVSRGEGAIAPTAVAEGRAVSGTARAARALARLGEGAAREVRRLYGSHGHRARVSVAHAFGAVRLRATDAERDLVTDALGTLVAYGETLDAHGKHATAGGMLAHELRRRAADTRDAVLDLLGVVEDRRAIAHARLALQTEGRARDDAMELLEATLPAGLGPRFVSLLSGGARPVDQPAPLDGWLEKCRKRDLGELPSSDPMAGVLDKVLLLRDVPIFQNLSGEELYPVAEIAAFESAEPGAIIVRQGDASDDLFIVAEGEVAVRKDEQDLTVLGAGKAFGELGVLDGAPRAATVSAKTQVRLLRVPRIELEALLDESPELAKGIIQTLLGYVRTGKQA